MEESEAPRTLSTTTSDDKFKAFKQIKHELLRPENKAADSVDKDQDEPLDNDSNEARINQLSQNGFIRLNTRDTSFVGEHIPRIETFAQDLQAAVQAVWPSRVRGRYSEIQVLLLSWEDDSLGVETEIQLLGDVFRRLYHFDVQEFRIPRKTPGKATMRKVSEFLENDSPDILFIVYYAGHANLSHQANDPPIWTANGQLNSPTLPSGGVQQLFEEAESDVLLLYDSCHSSHPAINGFGQGVTEVIAACGFETQAPAVGPHSFTNALIRELEEGFSGPPFSVAELHSRMIGSLKHWRPGLLRNDDGNVWTGPDGRPTRECYKRRTPVHCFLTNETPYRSIMLSPLPLDSLYAATDGVELSSRPDSSASVSCGSFDQPCEGEASSSAQTSIPETDPADSLQVLLAVRLEEDFFDADDTDKVRIWCEWLRNIPQGTRDVKIQGVYKSLSTLLIISIPLTLWNLLPNNSAYSFIGFVRSDNLASGLQQNNPLIAMAQTPTSSEYQEHKNRSTKHNLGLSKLPTIGSQDSGFVSFMASPDERFDTDIRAPSLQVNQVAERQDSVRQKSQQMELSFKKIRKQENRTSPTKTEFENGDGRMELGLSQVGSSLVGRNRSAGG